MSTANLQKFKKMHLFIYDYMLQCTLSAISKPEPRGKGFETELNQEEAESTKQRD